MNSNAVPGLICAFGFDAFGRGRTLPEENVSFQMLKADEWPWLHLSFADWRCRRWLAENFNLPAELAREISDPPVRQPVSAWEGVLFGLGADFRRELDTDSTELAWFHFSLGEQFLIAGRVRAVQSADRLPQVIGVDCTFASPASLLSHILSIYTNVVDMAQLSQIQHLRSV